MKAFGRKSKWAASTCAYSLSATRWACRRRFTTSKPRVGSPPPEAVDDIEQGKEKAAAYAEADLKRVANFELPRWYGNDPAQRRPPILGRPLPEIRFTKHSRVAGAASYRKLKGSPRIELPWTVNWTSAPPVCCDQTVAPLPRKKCITTKISATTNKM
jgi:hypothetical protein